jgi:Tfp pilus assembly protein PilV
MNEFQDSKQCEQRIDRDIQAPLPNRSAEAGFTLIEITCAMLVIFIALVGVAQVFTYSIAYNSGNAVRADALAILQRQVENIRAAKWTASGMDPALNGGVQADQTANSSNNGQFRISVTVDDDPFTDGVQVDSTSLIKEITITVILDSPSPGWQFAVPSTVVLRRTRGN